MSPCSNSKPWIKFVTWGIWAGLSQARTSTVFSSAVGAGHFLQRGGKNPTSGRRQQGGGGEVLGSDGKTTGVGFGKKDRDWRSDSRSAISVLGEPWLQHVQYPVKGRAQYFLLNAYSNPLPIWLQKLAMDLLFLFLPSYPAAPVPAHTVPTQPVPLRRRAGAGKAPRRLCSPSPPRSSSLRKLSLLIFFFYF